MSNPLSNRTFHNIIRVLNMSYTSLVASIIKCLKQLLEEDHLTPSSRESLEVAIQCLESAYSIQASDSIQQFDIFEAFRRMQCGFKQNGASACTPEVKAEAERLKNEGNTLTKNEKYHEALINYTKAIELDNKNAVFYCNRAAVYSKIGNDQQAIKDCYSALSIDPTYSKAYGRLGLAYSNLNKYKDAKECYQKALELEPDNESLKNNLNIADEKLREQCSSSTNVENQSSNIPEMDLSSLLSNPTLMNMARQMLSDPTMQNMMSSLMTDSVEHAGRMDALIEAGQQLAQQMQTSNPELIESLRRQMGRNMNNPDSTEKKDF